MSETPISVDGQIDIHYTQGTVDHILQLRCEITTAGMTPPFNLLSVSSGTILWTDAVDDLVPLLQPLMKTTTVINQAVLQRYDAGTYILLDSYSIGLAGTSTAAANPAAQETFTFRDLANKLVKVVLLGGVQVPPQHLFYAGLSTAQKNFVDSILANTAGTIGDWMLGRGGNDVRRFIAWTCSINKRWQRELGFG